MTKNKIIIYSTISVLILILGYHIPSIKAYCQNISRQLSGDINNPNSIVEGMSLESKYKPIKISQEPEIFILNESISNSDKIELKTDNKIIRKKIRKKSNNIIKDSTKHKVNKSDENEMGTGNSIKTKENNTEKNVQESNKTKIPAEFNLELQFYPQAPYGNWREPFQDACEEACVILAYNYIMDKKMTRDEFKNEILRLVNRENEHFGGFKDSNIRKTTKIIEEVYNFTGFRYIDTPSIEDIQNEIFNGNIIIAPFYGKGLKNPHYSNGGPEYHFMVIKGYDKEHFITHDVGTSKGRNFKYKKDLIIDMIHDWNNGDVLNGDKMIIVMEK